MIGFDLASQIKERLTAQEVVEFYGFHPDRSGFIQCPFHQGDRHASLKVYSGNKTGWHCFGCGAGGSVIDFVMKLFDIDFRQACVRLNMDFSLGLTGERPTHAERSALLVYHQNHLHQHRCKNHSGNQCYFLGLSSDLDPEFHHFPDLFPEGRLDPWLR